MCTRCTYNGPVLTITTTILLAVCLALMVTTKTVLKNHARTTTVLTAFMALAIAAIFVMLAISAPKAFTVSPPVILYLATPILAGMVYGFATWRRNHPGALSGSLVAVLKALLRIRNTRRRTNTKRNDETLASRPYLTRILGSWIRLVLKDDTAIWCVIHMVMIEAGFLLALYAPVLPYGTGYLIGYIPALVSFIRWKRIDAARQTVINDYYGFASDQFGYERAARQTRMAGHEQFADPNACVSVQWREMTEPEVVTIAFPQSFEKTNMTKREKFSKEFEATYANATVKKFIWNTGKQTVTVVAANYPESVRWDGEVTRPWHSFVVGVALDTGKKIVLSVKDQAPHILIAGETGSGKSETMFVIAAQAMLKGWTIALCDPKATGWVAFTQNFRYTGVAGPGTGAEPLKPGDARQGLKWHAIDLYGIHTVIKNTWAEVERRKAIDVEHRATSVTDLPQEIRDRENISPYMLIVDEALSLFAQDSGGGEETDERNALRGELLSVVIRIIVEARALQIHTMLGFQRPDTKYVDGSARDNLGIRIGLGKFSQDGAKMVYGSTEVPDLPIRKDGIDPETEVETTKPGESDTEDTKDGSDATVKGRGQARLGSGQPIINFQSYWCGPKHADLDKYLPMPEAIEHLDNAPTDPVDTSLDKTEDPDDPAPEPEADTQEDGAGPEGQERINRPGPWRPTDDPTTQYPTRPGNEEAAVVTKAPEPTEPATMPVHDDPFGVNDEPEQDAWASTAQPWPGVTEPEQSATEAETVNAREDSLIVDTKQGRVGYSAPVTWQVHESDEMFEADTGLFGDGLFSDAAEDHDTSIEGTTDPNSAEETGSPQKDAQDPEPSVPPAPNATQADFAAFLNDLEQPAGNAESGQDASSAGTTMDEWSSFLQAEEPQKSNTTGAKSSEKDEEWF